MTGLFRSQWIGFEGAPQSFLLSVHSPFLSKRVGVGVNLSQRKVGLTRDFNGALAYSYDLVSRKDMSLRVGLSGSVRSQNIAFSEAKPGDKGDPSIDNVNTNEILGNVGAGLYATFAEKFYVGLSVPRIYTNRIGFNPTLQKVAEESIHYYAMAGVIIPIGEDVNLMPAVLAKYVKNAPFDADINLNLDIRQKFTTGISYRAGGDGAGDSVDLLAFWQASPQMGVGVAYDFPLSKIKNYSTGSVEVLLQADLKKRKKGMSNPRFFM
jgi:type IX secretion system PorP/SprF family membrane protein